jgi:predicted protein tyrosine phosphatase
MLQMTKTELMMHEMVNDLTCPVDNQFQGEQTRLLFVCSAGLLRSPTGAAVAVKQGFNARSCGSCNHMALIPITVNLVHWAKYIVFMNQGNFDEALHQFFGDYETCELIRLRARVMDIEDDYDYMDRALVQKFLRELNSPRYK